MSFSLPCRCLSYLYPLPLSKGLDLRGKPVRLELYRGQPMLSTALAVYSYGTRYYPFRKPFAHLGKELYGVKRFLLLGTGLGSALKILQEKHGAYPDSVLLDLDPLMLQWSRLYMDLNKRNNVQWLCTDAEQYVEETKDRFDLIGLDIFTDMTPPSFAKSESFFLSLRNLMHEGGILVFNAYFSSLNEQQMVEDRLQRVFRSAFHIPHDRNAFYICRV